MGGVSAKGVGADSYLTLLLTPIRFTPYVVLSLKAEHRTLKPNFPLLALGLRLRWTWDMGRCPYASTLWALGPGFWALALDLGRWTLDVVYPLPLIDNPGSSYYVRGHSLSMI